MGIKKSINASQVFSLVNIHLLEMSTYIRLYSIQRCPANGHQSRHWADVITGQWEQCTEIMVIWARSYGRADIIQEINHHTETSLGWLGDHQYIFLKVLPGGNLTLKVLVATIDAQWEGMGDVGSARYEPALLLPCLTIRALTYSN